MIGLFFDTIIGASTDRVVSTDTWKLSSSLESCASCFSSSEISLHFGFYAVRGLPVLLFISWCFVWNNWATHWGCKIEIGNNKLRGWHGSRASAPLNFNSTIHQTPSGFVTRYLPT